MSRETDRLIADRGYGLSEPQKEALRWLSTEGRDGHPPRRDATWHALERLGLVEYRPGVGEWFGRALTRDGWADVPDARRGRAGADRRRPGAVRARSSDEATGGRVAVALRTRQPTGKIPPPVILLEGDEGAGKSWSAAELSASDKVGRTVWLQVGTENTADEYGEIPGVRYEIVEHDGTWHDIYGQVIEAKDEAAQAKAAGDKPLVLVIDQVGAIWELLSDWAHNRAKGSTANRKKLAADPNAEIDVTPNYWNDANERWRKLMTTLLTFPGIVVILARGRETALIENGRPVVGKKDYRVEGQKSMPFDVPVWVRLTRDGNPTLVKLRSVRNGVKPGSRPRPLPGFSVEKLIFEVLGWDPQTGGERALTAMQAGDDAPESARFKAFMAGVETADLDELRRMWKQHVPAAVEQGEISEAEADKVREAIMAAKAQIEAQQAQPPDARPALDQPTEKQHKRMHALWRELGLGGDEHREDRLVQTAGFVGREVASSKELTPEEADKVIAELDRQTKAEKTGAAA